MPSQLSSLAFVEAEWEISPVVNSDEENGESDSVEKDQENGQCNDTEHPHRLIGMRDAGVVEDVREVKFGADEGDGKGGAVGVGKGGI